MEVSFLADSPHESKKIAQWYFEEWVSAIPNVTLDMVYQKILRNSESRTDIPLMFIIHDDRLLFRCNFPF